MATKKNERVPLLTGVSRPAVSMGAVFLSYASQDAEAAKRICKALRGGGIQVFLDQSDLRGGDAWDQKIRHEIHDCVLFIPIVSEHTQERLEGYFRHEWKLAIERTHHMAEQKPFLVPVVIDGIRDQDAFVPDAFRAVQWTHLPGGDTSAAFVERIRRLLSPELLPLSAGFAPASGGWAPASRWSRRLLPVAAVVVVLGAMAYLAIERPWVSKPGASAAFAPPAHSIAVLPFVNMSGDKEQEYFSEGLTEELLNSLSRINELQVAARTSSFSFQGEHPDITTVAHKLNVASVLEGSVRRAGNRIRVTAQLINAVTGFHLWSETYDRDLNDVLKLQTEIATAVTSALKVTLLGNVAEKVELGGTHNPEAFDAYLRGLQAVLHWNSEQDLKVAIAAYSKAILFDPNYARAFAARSRAFTYLIEIATTPASTHEALDKAKADADEAIALAPDLDESHLALALVYQSTLNFALASDEYDRALSLSPGNARTLWRYTTFAVLMGQTETGIAAARRSVALDPLEWVSRSALGNALYIARHYKDALSAVKEAQTLAPDRSELATQAGIIYYALGDFQGASRSCESRSADPQNLVCLAIAYDKLGRHSEAETALTKLVAVWGESGATTYAFIYAEWGNATKAIEWLDTAMRWRDPSLISLRMDPLFDPLRKEPRFQAIERALKFPEK